MPMDFLGAIGDGNGGGGGGKPGLSKLLGGDSGHHLLPAGPYVARILLGEQYTSKASGDTGYKLEYSVIDGPYAGRTVTQWLSSKSPTTQFHARKTLKAIGITTTEQLEAEFPEVGKDYHVEITVVIRPETDDYPASNSVQRVRLLQVKETPAAKYALPPLTEEKEGGTQ